MILQLLHVEGYESLDPVHPRGGPDGKSDIICYKNELKWVVAVHFSRGQENFTVIQKRFKDNFKGVAKNDAHGFIYATNQPISKAERKQLKESVNNSHIEIYHLERISSLLNHAECIGIRLAYLDIWMEKEEMLSFIAYKNHEVAELQQRIQELFKELKKFTSKEQLLQIAESLKPQHPRAEPIIDYVNGIKRSTRTCKYCQRQYIVDEKIEENRFNYTMREMRYLQMEVGSKDTISTCPYCNSVNKHYSDPIVNFLSQVFRF